MNQGVYEIMRILLILGILLVAAGVMALAYQGITYTSEKRVIDVGPVKGSVEEKKTIPLPPIVGGASLAAGIVLVIIETTRRV